MSAHPHSLIADETLDGCFRCECCDKPRPGPIAFCDDCEETTHSRFDDGDYDRMVAQTQLEASVMASMDRIAAYRTEPMPHTAAAWELIR